MNDFVLYNGAYNGPQVDAAVSRALSGGALDQAIAALRAAVGSPLVAATKAAMTDTSKIYVYTGSEAGMTAGNWYYWNGSAWTTGGVYNSAATDGAMSDSSENAVQNKVIKAYVDAAEAAAKEAAYDAYPTETPAAAASVSTDIGADAIPLKALSCLIEAIWAGSGTPAPDNIREITGFTGVTITRNAGQPTISFDWQTQLGTIYGGTLDVLTGVLTVTHWGHAFNGEEPLDLSDSELSVSWSIANAYKSKTLSEEWTQTKRLPYSSHYRVAGIGNYSRVSLATSGGSAIFSYVDGYNVPINLPAFKTYLAGQAAADPPTPVTLVWVLDTPITLQLTAADVATVLGENVLTADAGSLTATFRCDPTLALDELRNAILSLGNNT